MKVFITGIAGFLGSHLAEALLKEGHEVSGCDNLKGGEVSNVPKGATWFNQDCNDWVGMLACTQEIDVVYHCAAIACEGLSVFSPDTITKSIVTATSSVLSASIHNGVKRFVYLSSMARYGDQKVPFLEINDVKPIDPYGIAKVAGEMLVKNLCETHGMEYVIAVPHNIIGTRQKYDDPFRNVASIFINRALQGKQPVIYGKGDSMRCFSFVQDCVDSLVKMASYDVSGEIINIGPDENESYITIYELAKMVCDLTGLEFKPIHVEDRPCEVKLAHCSSNKARKLLAYETRTSLKDGLYAMVEAIKLKGTKEFNYHLPIEIEKGVPETWKKKLI